MSTIITIGTLPGAGVCDFCFSPKIYAAHDCKDFAIRNSIFGSTGGFAACKFCHQLIAADKWPELLNRSVYTFIQQNVPPKQQDDIDVYMRVKNFVSEIHEAFRTNRTGKFRILEQ